MLRLKYGLLFLISWLLLAPVAFAHLIGQPPFFVVDGVYSNLYPVPVTSLYDFALPQDLVAQNFLVNESINFKFDQNRLPAPPEIVAKTKFAWDFGDGSSGEGLAQTHTYTKMGSYIIKITADDGTTPTPQLLESALVNVLPDKNYKLPQAIIKVNGRQSKDPLTDVLQFPLGQTFHFDGSSSVAPSSKIVSYFWDFGDQKSSTKAVDDHYYPGDLTQIFPVLRVIDANGFIGDNFVEVENHNQGVAPLSASASPTAAPSSPSKLPWVIAIIIIITIILMARLYARAPGHGRHRQNP